MDGGALQTLGLAIYVLVSIVFCITSLLLAKIVAPSRPNPRKSLTYECGQVPTGPTRSRFTIQYYPYAIIYAIYGALAIVLLLSAPSIKAMSPAQLWVLLMVVGAFAFALISAVLTVRTALRRPISRRGGLGA